LSIIHAPSRCSPTDHRPRLYVPTGGTASSRTAPSAMPWPRRRPGSAPPPAPPRPTSSRARRRGCPPCAPT
jgi:hypothetical protein